MINPTSPVSARFRPWSLVPARESTLRRNIPSLHERSRPLDVHPTFKILANRQDITDLIKSRLLSLTITDQSGIESDRAEIILDDRDFQIELPRPGAELEIHLGYQETGLIKMGFYVVDEISLSHPPATMMIKAKAVNMRASLKAPKTRAWEKLTLGDLVHQIAKEQGLQAKVDPTLAHEAIDYIAQSSESDLHLLTRLAVERDALAKVAANYLLFMTQAKAKTISGQNLTTVQIKPKDILNYRVTIAERSNFNQVVGSWQDQYNAVEHTVKAGEGEPSYRLRFTYGSEKEAQQAVKAKLAQFQRGKSKLNLSVMGQPELQAEGKIVLAGFRNGVDGKWVVNTVNHQLNNSGLISQIQAAHQ